MLLTCQNVIIFALLHIHVRMFGIYRAFCESHSICDVMRRQLLLNIFIGEQK